MPHTVARSLNKTSPLMRIERESERGEEAEKEDEPLEVWRGGSSGPGPLVWMCPPACPSPGLDVSGSAQRQLGHSYSLPTPTPPPPPSRFPGGELREDCGAMGKEKTGSRRRREQDGTWLSFTKHELQDVYK